MTAITDIMARAIRGCSEQGWAEKAQDHKDMVRGQARRALSALSEAGYVVVKREEVK